MTELDVPEGLFDDGGESFAAEKKLTEQIRDACLSADVFPELHDN